MSGRRIILYQSVSADGYFATADGALDWVVHEPAIEQNAMASMAAGPGTLMFGRKTYDQFESFWPHALDGGGPRGPHGDANPDAIRAMANHINAAEKIVFSRTRTAVSWQGSRLIRDFDPKVVEAIKREPGRDIMVFGSGSIVARLTEHRLIDEYMLVVSPVLLGAGKPLLAGVATRTTLVLQQSDRFPSGVVLSRYRLGE